MLRKYQDRKQRGFSLAELLVVVAIIAILVAVSIPVFTGKLEKSREVTDVANMRAAKAAGANAFYNEGYLDGTVWNVATVHDPQNPATVMGHDYSAVYDAVKGAFFIDASDVKPYGKGTTKDGGTSYGDKNDPNGNCYNSKLSYENQLINVVISIRTGYPEQLIIRWYKDQE